MSCGMHLEIYTSRDWCRVIHTLPYFQPHIDIHTLPSLGYFCSAAAAACGETRKEDKCSNMQVCMRERERKKMRAHSYAAFCTLSFSRKPPFPTPPKARMNLGVGGLGPNSVMAFFLSSSALAAAGPLAFISFLEKTEKKTGGGPCTITQHFFCHDYP